MDNVPSPPIHKLEGDATAAETRPPCWKWGNQSHAIPTREGRAAELESWWKRRRKSPLLVEVKQGVVPHSPRQHPCRPKMFPCCAEHLGGPAEYPYENNGSAKTGPPNPLHEPDGHNCRWPPPCWRLHCTRPPNDTSSSWHYVVLWSVVSSTHRPDRHQRNDQTNEMTVRMIVLDVLVVQVSKEPAPARIPNPRQTAGWNS